MRNYIIITHAKLADGLKSSVELILGEQDKLTSYCAYLDPDKDVPKIVEELVRSKSAEDEYIIMTDLLGGSVNTAMMKLLDCEKVHIVTGANLLLVMQLLLMSDESDPCEEIPEIVEQAKEGIAYVNMLSSADEEDF